MQINVSGLLKGSIGASRDYEINEVVDYREDNLTIPVNGHVKLVRTNRSILVKGNLNVSVKTTCARCLEDFDCFFASVSTAVGTGVMLKFSASALGAIHQGFRC